MVLSWAAVIFLSLATEGAGCDFSPLILKGWHPPAPGGIACAGVPQSWNEQLHQQQGQHTPDWYRNSPSPAGNDCVTVNPAAPWSETILLPTRPKSKMWLISWLNSAGLYFARSLESLTKMKACNLGKVSALPLVPSYCSKPLFWCISIYKPQAAFAGCFLLFPSWLDLSDLILVPRKQPHHHIPSREGGLCPVTVLLWCEGVAWVQPHPSWSKDGENLPMTPVLFCVWFLDISNPKNTVSATRKLSNITSRAASCVFSILYQHCGFSSLVQEGQMYYSPQQMPDRQTQALLRPRWVGHISPQRIISLWSTHNTERQMRMKRPLKFNSLHELHCLSSTWTVTLSIKESLSSVTHFKIYRCGDL